MSTDFRALCAELLQLEQEQPAEYTDWKRRYNAAIARVRAALAHPEPAPTAWMYQIEPDFDGKHWHENWKTTLDEKLARYMAGKKEPIPLWCSPTSPPEPVAPTDEQTFELADDLGIIRGHGGDLHVSLLDLTPFAESLLTRYARPAIEPVPVSERPWEREGWCDAEGMCWWGHPSDDQTNAGWVPGTWEDVEMVGLDSFTISLPHHALPAPNATNG